MPTQNRKGTARGLTSAKSPCPENAIRGGEQATRFFPGEPIVSALRHRFRRIQYTRRREANQDPVPAAPEPEYCRRIALTARIRDTIRLQALHASSRSGRAVFSLCAPMPLSRSVQSSRRGIERRFSHQSTSIFSCGSASSWAACCFNEVWLFFRHESIESSRIHRLADCGGRWW